MKDVIVGKIYFLLVRIKIKHMEIAIIKKETTGIGQNTYNDNENIAKYEIMDGAPVRGESIPIRLFLAGYDLTPTMKDINKKFSVRYYLNLVLVDEEERRYFKQQEIILWRKGERIRRPIQTHTMVEIKPEDEWNERIGNSAPALPLCLHCQEEEMIHSQWVTYKCSLYLLLFEIFCILLFYLLYLSNLCNASNKSR